MSFTPGFKKFVGLLAVTALVGGGIYAVKSGMIKTHSVPAEVEAEQPTEAAQQNASQEAQPVQQDAVIPSTEPVPVQRAQSIGKPDALDALIHEAGKK
jgi:hypothetical protein